MHGLDLSELRYKSVTGLYDERNKLCLYEKEEFLE